MQKNPKINSFDDDHISCKNEKESKKVPSTPPQRIMREFIFLIVMTC